MNITINVRSDYSPFGPMAFSADWQDDTHRYHVWIGLRDDNVPYPVKIEQVIYKNSLTDRMANTIRMDLNAKRHTKIKRLATPTVLLRLFNDRKAEIDAQDAMRAEADRLNAIFNAVRLLDTADTADLSVVRVMMNTTRI